MCSVPVVRFRAVVSQLYPQRSHRNSDSARMVVEFFILANTVIALVSTRSLDCESRSSSDNGQTVFTASKNWRRAVEVYQCNAGYVLKGQTKHTCTDGQWSGSVPSCVRISDAGLKNTISSAQGWFSFRRILRQNVKQKLQNNTKRMKNNTTSTEAPSQKLGLAFQFPKNMIRDSAKEYTMDDYDLSCLFRKRHGKHFLRAPELPFARLVKYSRKKNTVHRNNKYLEAIYLCAKGHVFENPSQNKLYCSNGFWVGVKPSCVPKTTPMTAYQMECYIKCPPDKNVSLAEGAKSINFEVEQPKTNYDWARYGKLSSGWHNNLTRSLVPGLYVITYSVRDQEDMDIASCRTSVRVTDDEPPTVRDCPLYLQVIEDFSKNDTVPVSWPEPWFLDNVAVTQVSKTMKPGESLGVGMYSVLYIAMDASRNEATCNFTIEVKDRATFNIENQNTNETLDEALKEF